MVKSVNSPNIKIVSTQDGSNSLWVPELNEQYHSRFGAITESQYIYIDQGFKVIPRKNLSIFEVGFGTGLNAFLSLIEGKNTNKIVNYFSIELYPVPLDIVKQLNYPAKVINSDLELYMKLHQVKWNSQVEICANFTLKKIRKDFSNYIFENKFDLVYFDAFAPDLQPELWTEERFSSISEAMNAGAILVTYSSKGDVRRKLISAGFEVRRLPGPPGKREIIQAVKL